MSAPHWTERRKEYLAEKGKTGAKVISIADGFLTRLVRTAHVTADDIRAGARCTNEFLAKEIRQGKGAREKSSRNAAMGAGEGPAPMQLDLPGAPDASGRDFAGPGAA